LLAHIQTNVLSQSDVQFIEISLALCRIETVFPAKVDGHAASREIQLQLPYECRTGTPAVST
jgi:hypothetical protein